MSVDPKTYADAELLGETNDDILAARRPKAAARPGARVGWVAIVLAVFAGVAFGSWLASRSAPSASPTPTARVTAPTTPAAPATTVAPQVRMIELEDLIAADPNNVDARLELGVLLYEQLDDIDGAGEQWLAVTQIDPTSIGAWYNLGFYYLSTDPISCGKAVAAWNKVIELQPDSAEAGHIVDHMAAIIPERCPAYAGQLGSPSPTSGG